MSFSDYPSPEGPRDDNAPNRATEVRDEAVFRLIKELKRAQDEHFTAILSKIDRLIWAVEFLADTKHEFGSSTRSSTELPSIEAPGRQPRESSISLEPSANDHHTRAFRSSLAFLHDNYLQIAVGLAVALIALLVAVYLFTRAR